MSKIYFFISLFITSICLSQSLEKDAAFNPFSLSTDNYYVDGIGTKCLVQPDGKILIVESTFVAPTTSKLTRITTGNAIDPAFANNIVFNGLIRDLAIQSDGKIVIVGSFSTVNGIPSKYIVRLNVDGTIDNSFTVGTGFTTYGNSNYTFASAVAIRPDGKIFVGGDLAQYNGSYKNSLFLLNTDGTLDPSFTLDSWFGQISISKIKLLSDSNILITNQFFSYIYKLNPDGSKHATDFTTTITLGSSTSPASNTVIHSLVEEANGKIVVGGRFDRVNSINYKDLIRLNSNGTFDNTFLPTGFNGTYTLNDNRVGVTSILLQDDGKFIVAGDFRQYAGEIANGILRLNSDFTKDANFNGGIDNDTSDASHYYSYFNSLAWYPDGDIVGVGHFKNYNNISSNNITKINTDGSKESTFNNICRGFDESVDQFELQPDGKILAIGRFHSYNGANRNRIVRLNSDGNLDSGFEVATESFMLDYLSPRDIKLQPDGKILIASDGRYFGTSRGGSVVRLNADGSNDASFNPLTVSNYGLRGQCMTLAVQPDGKILVGGNFQLSTSNTTVHLIRVNSDGTVDPSFQFVSPFPSVDKIELLPDGKILAIGKIDTYRSKIIRILSTGTADPSFVMDPSLYFVNNKNLYMNLHSDGKILVTSDSPGYSRHTIARINSDGSLDNTFSFPTINTYFYAYQCATGFLPDGRILIATPNTVNASGLLRINSNGTVDTGFDLGSGFGNGNGFAGGPVDKIAAIKVQPDGKILLGGGFRTFQGVPERGIARLINNSLDNPTFLQKINLSLYPNPSTGILNIGNIENATGFRIFNIVGQKVHSGKTLENRVDIANLASGVYIIEITKDSAIHRGRFIKE